MGRPPDTTPGYPGIAGMRTERPRCVGCPPNRSRTASGKRFGTEWVTVARSWLSCSTRVGSSTKSTIRTVSGPPSDEPHSRSPRPPRSPPYGPRFAGRVRRSPRQSSGISTVLDLDALPEQPAQIHRHRPRPISTISMIAIKDRIAPRSSLMIRACRESKTPPTRRSGSDSRRLRGSRW